MSSRPQTAQSFTLDRSRLESLLESATLLNSTLKLDDLLRHLLRTAMGRFLVTRGAVAIERAGRCMVEIARGVSALKTGSVFAVEAAREAGLELFFDIGYEEQRVGVLALSRPARGPLSEEDADFLRALLGLAASVIENALSHEKTVSLNRTLDQKIQELRALLDLVRGLAATLDPEEVARLLMLTFAGRWALTRCGVATWRDGQAALLRQRGLNLSGLSAHRDAIAALPPAAIIEPESDFAALVGLPGGAMILPIRSGGSTWGAVVCGPRLRNVPYNDDDLEFGAGLVAQAAVAFDNAWHFRETIGKKQMEKELALAASIQLELFPKKLPDLHRTGIAARNRQARQVGGDYYDVIGVGPAQPPGERLACVVDISGKGMFASLLMSNIQATLRALLCRENCLPVIAHTANELLYATTPSNRYATAFLMIYEDGSGHCRWINCGHNDGILLRANGGVEMLACSGLALGLFPKQTYEEQHFELREGDLLAIYSDGVPDAQNEAEEEFSTERLVEVLAAERVAPAPEIVDRVFGAIDAFTGNAPQFDDITLLVMKRTA
ncbi:MAG TPA: SpoIIE family protein phosphatase [Bryobacteraceae bacterium]|nr:SpoIIE family protein phosphatase [Bryobacteraceae bacterium]